MSRSTFLFNPAMASTEELEALLVGREALMKTLMEDVESQYEGGTIQHFLIVGPRGTGKTHLTEVLARRLARSEESHWTTVRLPEESYSMAGLRGLLSGIVDRALDLVRGWDARVPEIEESIEQLSDFRKRSNTPMLVIVENLPRVLKRILHNDREISQLRSLLMNDPLFTLIATATSYFEDISREDRPLYDFFRVLTLENLTDDEIEELVIRRAKWDGIVEEPEDLDMIRRRVLAIKHLSGGNPRLILALYEVIRNGVTKDIMKQFTDLLDKVTPYYQSRLDDLSRQQAMVLAKLSTAPGAVAASTLGKLVELSTSHTTAVLNVLLAERFVKRIPGKSRGRNLYAVADRLFRIWLEMRESIGAPAKLKFITEFYRMAYSKNELAEVLDTWCSALSKNLLSRGAWTCRDHILTIDYLSDALGIPETSKAWRVLKALKSKDPWPPEDLGRIHELAVENEVDHPFAAAALHVELAEQLLEINPDFSSEELERARSLAPKWNPALWPLWWYYLEEGNESEIVDISCNMSDSDDQKRRHFVNLIKASARFLGGVVDGDQQIRDAFFEEGCAECRARWVAEIVGRGSEKLKNIDSFAQVACDLAENHPLVLVARSSLLIRQGSYEEAVEVGEEATKADSDNSEAWVHFACALAHCRNPEGFAAAAWHALNSSKKMDIIHTLNDCSLALSGTENPAIYRKEYERILGKVDLGIEELVSLYDGLWRSCKNASISWTAEVAKLWEELSGKSIEPWRSFVEFVEADFDASVMAAMHQEIQEAVEILVKRHGLGLDELPLVRKKKPSKRRERVVKTVTPPAPSPAGSRGTSSTSL